MNHGDTAAELDDGDRITDAEFDDGDKGLPLRRSPALATRLHGEPVMAGGLMVCAVCLNPH
jgi:hypothetical protein